MVDHGAERFPPIPPQDLTDEQREVHDSISKMLPAANIRYEDEANDSYPSHCPQYSKYHAVPSLADTQIRISFKSRDDDTGALIGPTPFLLTTPVIARVVGFHVFSPNLRPSLCYSTPLTLTAYPVPNPPRSHRPNRKSL